MAYFRMFAAAAVLVAVFLFGMALTWPAFPYNSTGFPLNRRFVAISLNGEPINYERLPHLPTLEVRRSALLRLRTSGSGGCNAWSGDIVLSAGQSIAWKDIFVTAVGCAAMASERTYLKALLQTTRWRREEGTLILENDTDVLRFQLAPR
jgi:heat shock protein HslJ